MQKITMYLAYVFILTVISGCAHTVDVGKFKESNIDQQIADILPPQHVIDKKHPKVAVLPFGEPAEFSGKLNATVQEGITQIVAKGCGLDIVERSQAQKLFDEKKFVWSLDMAADFSELSKMAQGIDYVILGSVTNTGVGASFSPSRISCDKKGRCYTSDPSCSISSTATINIRVINAATGAIEQSFEPFKGTASGYFTVGSSHQCNVGNPVAVINQAVADGVKKSKKAFLEAFPRVGYLYKTMTSPDGKRIAYVNIGRLDGIKGGDTVELIRYVKEVDRVKKIERLTTQKIANVKIADTDLQDNRSIIVIDEEYSNQIMPGLAVKTKHNSGFSLFGN